MSMEANPEDAGGAGVGAVVVGEHGLTADIHRAVAEHDERLRSAMQQRRD